MLVILVILCKKFFVNDIVVRLKYFFLIYFYIVVVYKKMNISKKNRLMQVGKIRNIFAFLRFKDLLFYYIIDIKLYKKEIDED